MIDCLIVGQGIAGSCVAHSMMRRGKSIRVFAAPSRYPSSQLAAAVLNPVTGRKWVKTWNADELIPMANSFYTEATATLGSKRDFIRERRILLCGDDAEIQEAFAVRTGDPLYQDVVATASDDLDVPLDNLSVYGTIRGALQLDMGEFIVDTRIYLKTHGMFVQEQLDINGLNFSDGTWTYQDEQYASVIFAEGQYGFDNPWFKWLPYAAVKGELIVCEIMGLDTEDIIKGSVTIVPLPDPRIYWIGSTYEWDNRDRSPSKEGLAELMQGLKDIVGDDFSVLTHSAGVRMAAKDRRPFVGVHPNHEHVGILNGLGTKGASLAPYCAEALIEHMLEGKPLPSEIDILRYWPR